MASKSIVDKLNGYKNVSSWLLWDEMFKHDEVAKKYIFKTDDINTEYVFVALNASYDSDNPLDLWGSFHTTSRGDQNIKEAFKGSCYQGSYITDLLKYKDVENIKVFNDGDSVNAKDFICNYDNHRVFNANLRILKDEISVYDDNVKIFALGWDVYYMLKYNPSFNDKRIYYIPHFSPRVHNNGNSYKLAVDNALKQYEFPRLLDEVH